MSERVFLGNNGIRFDKEVFDNLIKASKEYVSYKTDGETEFRPLPENKNFSDAENVEYQINMVRIRDENIEESNSKRNYYHWDLGEAGNKNFGDIYELVFKSGALLPEEFIEEVKFFIENKNITNVVLTDSKYIGVSFPFLVSSPTSGDLFLSTFICYIRNMGINLLLTSSDNDYYPSAYEQSKLRTLCDVMITSEYDKRKKAVLLFGEGMVEEHLHCRVENVKNRKVRVVFNDSPEKDGDGRSYEMYEIKYGENEEIEEGE